jgi:hypothetical protein
VSGTWEHNVTEHQWELVFRVTDTWGHLMERRVAAWVTDEFIERVWDKRIAAVRLFNQIGTVPPPMQEYLPPDDGGAVLYDL